MTELVAALRLHGPTSAAMCENSMWAIVSLARDSAAVARLRAAGVCEGSVDDIYILIIHFSIAASPAQLRCKLNYPTNSCDRGDGCAALVWSHERCSG